MEAGRAGTAALGQAGRTTPSNRVFRKHLIAAEGNGGRWLSLPVTVCHAYQILIPNNGRPFGRVAFDGEKP